MCSAPNCGAIVAGWPTVTSVCSATVAEHLLTVRAGEVRRGECGEARRGAERSGATAYKPVSGRRSPLFALRSRVIRNSHSVVPHNYLIA